MNTAHYLHDKTETKPKDVTRSQNDAAALAGIIAVVVTWEDVEEVRPSLPRHSDAGATAPSPQEAVRGGRETSLFPYFLRR